VALVVVALSGDAAAKRSKHLDYAKNSGVRV